MHKPNYSDESAIKVPELTKRFTDFYSANFASNLAKQLHSEIQKFDDSLDTEHEVGGKLLSFGENITFHVSGISYRDPSLIIFYGFTNNGEPVKLMQNVSQISLLLIVLPKL
ncbi:MAG: hypothetical protein F6K08_30010 [Okeania sp. SIO1H6]|nr:DUF6173 family protein [Trichodesmium sp. MO_231.B1]NET16749.1 hypothetical protein [Okeania sp. SIO1H6]